MALNVSNLKVSYGEFLRMIDELYDEVLIYDHSYQIVYINKACERHYGMSQEEMIGFSFWDFECQYWDLSVLPYVYEEKKSVMQRQSTYLGSEILTIAIPLLNAEGEVEYVAMSVRDDFSNVQMDHLYDLSRLPALHQKKFNGPFFYKSEQMRTVIELLDQIKDISSPCLILGETGVGKTLAGKYLFEQSEKYHAHFVHLNCAAIHKDLIETELFGYARGTFTGAMKEGKKGLLETANGGVLFLDEISELPYGAQAKLLQFLQEREFYPVGAVKPVRVDLKIVTATNKNLKKMVENNGFREDLYYRLNVFEIEIPPLRDRKEDIKALAHFFLNKYNKLYQKEHKLSDEVLAIFYHYSWKGNARELAHVIERLVVSIKEVILLPNHLPNHLYSFESKPQLDYKCLADAVEDIERKMVLKAYHELKSTRKVGEKLGISQSTASRLLRKYLASI